jgi:hypothetical protein
MKPGIKIYFEATQPLQFSISSNVADVQTSVVEASLSQMQGQEILWSNSLRENMQLLLSYVFF